MAFAVPLAVIAIAARADQRSVLDALIGRPKADVIARLGPPSDRRIDVDGERLFYERIDAGRFGGSAGQGGRDGSYGSGLSLHDYDFRCRVEVVIRDGRVQAYNRAGSDCR